MWGVIVFQGRSSCQQAFQGLKPVGKEQERNEDEEGEKEKRKGDGDGEIKRG